MSPKNESTGARKPGPAKGDPRMKAFGRQGGEAVKEQQGADYFKRIGQMGGRATRAKHGPDYFAEIGRKGGTALKEAKGPAFYAEIGRKGGSRPRTGRLVEGETTPVPEVLEG